MNRRLDMRLKGKRIAILAEDLYDVLELWVPYYRMLEEGAEVMIVGSGSASVYSSKHGYQVEVDTEASEVSADAIDAVIVPGGFGPDRLRRYPAVLDLVKAVFGQGKLVAAICHGGWVLVSAGILRGRRATCVPAIKDDVSNAGADYVDEAVVVDGNLVTSRTPADLPVWLPAIISVLEEQ
jgi:protease I